MMEVLNSKYKNILDCHGDLQVLSFEVLSNGSIKVGMFEDIDPEIIPKECLINIKEFRNALFFQALMDIGEDDETNRAIDKLIEEVFAEYKNIFGNIVSTNQNGSNDYINLLAKQNQNAVIEALEDSDQQKITLENNLNPKLIKSFSRMLGGEFIEVFRMDYKIYKYYSEEQMTEHKKEMSKKGFNCFNGEITRDDKLIDRKLVVTYTKPR